MPNEYRVEISGRAERDILAIHDFIAREKKRAAHKWLGECERRILSLAKLPRRYEIIPEAEQFAEELRHDIFGSYRIVYRVEEDKVTVLRVIHAARNLGGESV